MTPEAPQFLDRAREDLSDARQIAPIGLAKVAARSPYYAAFHAAAAFIVEMTGRVAQSHSGVRNEFSRLAKDNVRISRTMTTLLTNAYRYKEIGDYGVGPKAVVTMPNAEAAMASAEAFLDCIE